MKNITNTNKKLNDKSKRLDEKLYDLFLKEIENIKNRPKDEQITSFRLAESWALSFFCNFIVFHVKESPLGGCYGEGVDYEDIVDKLLSKVKRIALILLYSE